MVMNYTKVTFTTIFLFLLLSASSNPSSASSQPPRVVTPNCTFVGKSTSFRGAPVHAYLGIPFARPPVGDLRFRRPLPPLACDDGPLVTDHLRAACVQFTTNPFPWLDTMPGKDIDCLYLNIWAPPPSEDKKLAVMVFLHGGGFRIGSNRLEYYDGTVMAAVGDVVVVVPNYRLGTEGFLYFGTEDAPGNMGLYDILESLKWVHRNIEHFGGDRERVTLFGQSSGAIAATMLMTSPLAEGLFQKVVLQSGSAANLDGEDNGRDAVLSRAVAEDVGCWTEDKTDLSDVVSCLRGKDALLLTKTVGKVSDNPQRGLYPRYGDDILPTNARESLIAGKFRSMPVLMGNTRDEGATMITKVYKDVFGFYGNKETHINKTFGEYLIRENFKNFSDLDALVEHYLGNVEESQDVRQQVQMASGDYARVCPLVFTAEAVAAERNPVYYYAFEHRPSPTPFAPWMGVVHFDETPFVFGYPLRFPDDYTLHERRLSARMVQIWTGFAKTELPWEEWPLFSRSHSNYVEIKGDTSWIKSSPSVNCDFFRPYFGFE